MIVKFTLTLLGFAGYADCIAIGTQRPDKLIATTVLILVGLYMPRVPLRLRSSLRLYRTSNGRIHFYRKLNPSRLAKMEAEVGLEKPEPAGLHLAEAVFCDIWTPTQQAMIQPMDEPYPIILSPNG